MMTKRVLVQTLTRLEVPVAQTYEEADREIAALAAEWKCPVLSNDSDFYIFGLPAGLLPITHFLWEDVRKKGSYSYIPAKRFYTSSFCIYFNIQPQLLPTFAILSGNDYVKLQGTIWAQFAPADCEKSRRLEGLIHWLKNFHQPQEALEAAQRLMGAPAKVLESLSEELKEYQLLPSSLKDFFIHGKAPVPAVEKGVIPDWTQLPLTQARLPGDVLDILVLKRLNLSIAVEHQCLFSSNLTSRPLRQVMYGLLLGGGASTQVVERDRDGLQLTFVPVKPTTSGVSQQVQLSSLHEVEPAVRLQILLEALGVKEELLSLLPPQLRLPVAVTCCWMKRARPPPAQDLLKALLLSMNAGDTLRQKKGLQAEGQRRHKKADVGVAHAFNQWQVCLKDGIHLNQLLGFPLPEPEVARLYQGTLVHHLVHGMRMGQKLRLKTNQVQKKVYLDMLSVVLQFHSSEASQPSQTQIDKPRSRSPQDKLTANLKRLFLLSEDEDTDDELNHVTTVEEELQLDEELVVRTRFRTKDRRNRCNRLELARKQECRGRDIC
ncbi:single-strand DNA endonuclease ASTE1 isoform 2-T2 [Pholidichthys leucotaenia]